MRYHVNGEIIRPLVYDILVPKKGGKLGVYARNILSAILYSGALLYAHALLRSRFYKRTLLYTLVFMRFYARTHNDWGKNEQVDREKWKYLLTDFDSVRYLLNDPFLTW